MGNRAGDQSVREPAKKSEMGNRAGDQSVREPAKKSEMGNRAGDQSVREPEIAKEIAALHKAIDMTKHEVERLREKISAVLRVPVPGPPPALNQGRIGVNVPRTPLAGVIKDARDKLTQSNNEIAEIIDFCEL